MPISIRFSTTETTDLEVRPDEVFRALAADEVVKSTAPGPVDYLQAIESGDLRPVVVLTPAAEFTAMFGNATTAAGLSDRDVAVVDTRTAAAAQALVVEATVAAARAGADLDNVVAAARDAAERAELVATLPTMEPLQRSGKLPAAALEEARSHGPGPIFRFRDGTVAVVEDESHAPIDAIRGVWERNGGNRAARSIVFHADRSEQAAQLCASLGPRATVIDFTPAMALHTGPGAVGVAWLRPIAP